MKKEPRKINRVSVLKIQYEAPEIILAMDRAAEKLAKQAGLQFWGSGYDFRIGIRDIRFR